MNPSSNLENGPPHHHPALRENDELSSSQKSPTSRRSVLDQYSFLQRIETVAKWIGASLHRTRATLPAYPTRRRTASRLHHHPDDPACLLAMDFCTSILQQAGRRLSFTSQNSLNEGATVSNKTDAKNMPTVEHVELTMKRITSDELAGACYIMNFLYAKARSRSVSDNFFQPGRTCTRMEGTIAASRLMKVMLIHPTVWKQYVATKQNESQFNSKTIVNTHGVNAYLHQSQDKKKQGYKSLLPPTNQRNSTEQPNHENQQQFSDMEPDVFSTNPRAVLGLMPSLSRMQGRILSIRHAVYCKETKCSLNPEKCAHFKKLYRHITTCKKKDQCIHPQCLETALVLQHYRSCRAMMCPLCIPVKLFVERSSKQENTVDDKKNSTTAADRPSYGNRRSSASLLSSQSFDDETEAHRQVDEASSAKQTNSILKKKSNVASNVRFMDNDQPDPENSDDTPKNKRQRPLKKRRVLNHPIPLTRSMAQASD